MSRVTTAVSTLVAADKATVFEQIATLDVPRLFPGIGILPAVRTVRDQTGDWNAADDARTIVFSDDSTARERLTRYVPGERLAYRVSDFTGPIRFFAHTANGVWRLYTGPPGQTRVYWRYTFHARSLVTVPLLWLIVKLAWHPAIRHALAQVKNDAESQVN